MASGFPDWLRAVQMLGKFNDVFTTVAVTEAGNLYVLLQGEDADHVLHTVRLDDEGRLSAFVIDSTDAWGQMLAVGNAELAVRLGSPVIYEQSGRVLILETFEQGLQRWTPGGGGDDNAVAISPEYSCSGGYSCKLTAGSTTTWDSYILLSQGVLPIGKVGIAFSFSAPEHFDNLEFILSVYDGVNVHHVRGRLDDVADNLEIYDDTPGWRDIGDASPASGLASRFYHVKLTANLVTGIYGDFKFNQQTIPLPTYSVQTGDAGGATRVDIHITLYGNDEDNDVVYIDNVVFTVGEP